jgi:hypothetical protein
MAYIPTVLYPTGTPASTGVTLYTVGANKSVIVKNLVMANTTGNEATITVHIVPSGGSASNTNRILSSYAVPANGASTLDCSIVMPDGSSLFAQNGTNGAVTLTISGVEIV